MIEMRSLNRLVPLFAIVTLGFSVACTEEVARVGVQPDIGLTPDGGPPPSE